MEDALGGAAVAARIVQHALLDPIGVEDLGGKFVAVHRQRQHPGHAGPVERKGVQRQLRHRHVLKIIEEKSLDALVRRAKMVGQQAFLLPVLRHQAGNDVAKFRGAAGGRRWKPSSASLTLM